MAYLFYSHPERIRPFWTNTIHYNLFCCSTTLAPCATIHFYHHCTTEKGTFPLYAPWPSAFLAPSVLISATDWHISITYCPDTMLCACIVGKAGSLVPFWSHEFSEICTEWTLLFNKTQVNELVLRLTIGGRHTSTYLLNIILCWRINLIKVGLYFHCTHAWRFYLWHIVTFIFIFFFAFILQLLSVAWPSFSLIFWTPSKWWHSGGQPPARQTKMVHSHPGALKKDEQLTYVTLHVYAYDSTPSKPTLVRRGVVAVSSCHWYTFINRCYLLLWTGRGSDFAVDSSVVGTIMWSQKCDSKRCMTCK